MQEQIGRYCDTVGIMEPFKLKDEISYLYNKTKFDIEMHTHNDFGMATANAIAGVWVVQIMLA